MSLNKYSLKKKVNRRRALAILGLSAAAAAYATPTLMKLNPAAASGGGSGASGASGGGAGGPSPAAANLLSQDPDYVQGCGECHDAYSPRLLPKGSWRDIMGDMGNHFGEDASLDEATRKKIEDYLLQNATRDGKGPLRISQSRWFRHEHKGDITKHKAKSWSNCTACHR